MFVCFFREQDKVLADEVRGGFSVAEVTFVQKDNARLDEKHDDKWCPGRTSASLA